MSHLRQPTVPPCPPVSSPIHTSEINTRLPLLQFVASTFSMNLFALDPAVHFMIAPRRRFADILKDSGVPVRHQLGSLCLLCPNWHCRC